MRLDSYIVNKFKVTRAQAKELILDGYIEVDGQVELKSAYVVKESDKVHLDHENAKIKSEPSVKPEPIPLDIMFEDESIIVINKQVGLVTHPASGYPSGTLVNALVNYGCPLSKVGGELRPGIVHRLDKDTEGLLVIAKK